MLIKQAGLEWLPAGFVMTQAIGHQVPHSGVQCESAVTADYLDILGLVVAVVLYCCTPVDHAVTFGVDRSSGYGGCNSQLFPQAEQFRIHLIIGVEPLMKAAGVRATLTPLTKR